MSKENNNSAGIEISKIKDLEEELLKNSAGINGQMSFIFDIEVEKTINGIQMGVLENGIAYLTQIKKFYILFIFCLTIKKIY